MTNVNRRGVPLWTSTGYALAIGASCRCSTANSLC